MLHSNSTTVSLSTAVPRPTERRADERLSAMLRVAQADRRFRQRATDQGQEPVRRRPDGDRHPTPPTVGEQVDIELSSQKIPASVVWIRDDMVGIKFDQNLDLGELLAGRKPRHGFRAAAAAPRNSVQGVGPRRQDSITRVDVHDISLGGIKVEPIEEYCVGKKVVVVVESLRPIKGEVRWYSDRRAGIVFDKPLEFDELSEWVGKRLELASLKASYKDG